jgi:hypothetical protein
LHRYQFLKVELDNYLVVENALGDLMELWCQEKQDIMEKGKFPPANYPATGKASKLQYPQISN